MTTNPDPTPVKAEMTYEQAIQKLREWQAQIIHGPTTFAEVADAIEVKVAAANLLLEAEKAKVAEMEDISLKSASLAAQHLTSKEQAESRCEAFRECLKGCVEAMNLGMTIRESDDPIWDDDDKIQEFIAMVEKARNAATALLGDGEGRRPFADPSGQNEPKGTDAGGQS